MLLSLCNFIYLISIRPYSNSKTNKIEAANEFSILLCAYLMNTLDVSTDVDFSTYLSWVFIGVCGINSFINLSMMVLNIIFTLYERKKKNKTLNVDEAFKRR